MNSNSAFVTKKTLVKKLSYLVKLPTKVDGCDLRFEVLIQEVDQMSGQ